eukprot:1710726-Pleurochrysis_carterae.AAC.1
MDSELRVAKQARCMCMRSRIWQKQTVFTRDARCMAEANEELTDPDISCNETHTENDASLGVRVTTGEKCVQVGAAAAPACLAWRRRRRARAARAAWGGLSARAQAVQAAVPLRQRASERRGWRSEY